MSQKITDKVLAILSGATINGNNIILNCEQLERKLYLDVNKVLGAMGGKWDRKVGGHIYADNPSDKLESYF